MIGHGCVITIGGNEDKRPAPGSLLGAFVARAGGADARIVVIPSASAEPVVRAGEYCRLFGELGVQDVRAIHAERGSVTDAERAALRNATGIFVTGGDQNLLMESLRATNCVGPILDAVHGGAVYAGTSAGASAASQTMIAGSTEKHDHIDFAEGLGLIPHVIIDQHFAERDRLPRLLDASRAWQLPGVGIDENTAIVWLGNGEALVKGTGAVTVVDLAHKLHVLRDGSRWQF